MADSLDRNVSRVILKTMNGNIDNRITKVNEWYRTDKINQGVYLALKLVLISDRRDIIEFIESNNNKENRRQLFIYEYLYEKENGEELMKLILDYYPEYLNEQSQFSGQTALMYTSWNNYEDMVKYLLDKGADPNKVDNVGKTALIYAVDEGHEKVVKMLLENGANPNIIYNYGTALTIASDNNNNRMAALLKKYNAIDPS